MLTRWPEWEPAALARYVDWAVRSLGPHRLMLASNWPVVLLRRDYPAAWHDLTEPVRAAGVDGADLAAVRGGNARRGYGLAQ